MWEPRFPASPCQKGGEMRWSGPWTAKSGIHPGSRNNLLIFFFVPKRGLLQQDGRIRGLHSKFITLADLRAPCGGIRNNPECGKVTVKTPPGANKKTYKTYWCFPV